MPSSSPPTRPRDKARNLAANPAAVVHLESGDGAVVVEGAVEPVREVDLLRRFVERYDEKYAFRPDPSQQRDFPATATRWTFPGRAGTGR